MSTNTDRPNFGPNQVRTVEGIHPGRYYIDSHRGGQNLILVVTPAVQIADGDWVFGVLNPDRDDPLSEQFLDYEFCSDCGIVPYGYGEYNDTNCLLRTRRKPLSAERVKEILAVVGIDDDTKEMLKLS